MIFRCQLCAVAPGSLLVLRLFGRGLDVLFARRGLFLRGRPGIYSTRASVIADAIYADVIVDHGLVDVGVVDVFVTFTLFTAVL